jgi:acyl-CoA synthetase (AMP-forming)/AMP-acid ligase II
MTEIAAGKRLRSQACGTEVIVVRDVHVRGDQVSGEYRGTASAVDSGGWLATRDRGWIDPDGYLFIEGRSDDTIIRGGENLAPAEIEDVLLDHPAVA